jgi:hypothetical protein
MEKITRLLSVTTPATFWFRHHPRNKAMEIFGDNNVSTGAPVGDSLQLIVKNISGDNPAKFIDWLKSLAAKDGIDHTSGTFSCNYLHFE